MNNKSNYTIKLGIFVIIGLTIFIIAIYFIGASMNLFGSTINLKTNFKNVGGLKVGNNVRFSGINIGTVKSIAFVSDTTVLVNFVIQKEVQKFIKIDAMTSIGSDGLMGDKILTISPGTSTKKNVNENDFIKSNKAIEMSDLLKSLKTSVDYSQIITKELADFGYKMNHNKGVVSKLLTDESFANSLEITLNNLKNSSNELSIFSNKMNDKNGLVSKLLTDESYSKSVEAMLLNFKTSSDEFSNFTKKMNSNKGMIPRLLTDEKLGNSIDTSIINIQKITKDLDETIKAAQNNFLLRGYFKKQKKAKEKAVKQQNNL